MGSDNIFFLELIEWFDQTGREMVSRIPAKGSGEIKYGAQLVVRESQIGIFFYNGKAVHVFGPGRHTLKTANIPILNKIMAIPWGLTSPLRAECYLVSTKVFTDLKWGTREPVAFRDAELGPVRLRAFGVFNLRIVQPLLFVNAMVGTLGEFSSKTVSEYLGRVIVSRLNDCLGETLSTLLDLPGQYDELSENLQRRLAEDFARFGLSLHQLYINSITPPPEVQKAIDDSARLSLLPDMNRFMQMKAAAAMEKAAENQGTAGDSMGMGVGFMMPAMMGQAAAGAAISASGGATPGSAAPNSGPTCPDCHQPVPVDGKFCPTCGHQLVVFTQCGSCGKNLSPGAKFCSRCGTPANQPPQKKFCSQCRAENLPGATFCNQCGSRL